MPTPPPPPPVWSRLRKGRWLKIKWAKPGDWIEKYPLDPYLTWADATGAMDFGSPTQKSTPILLELRNPGGLQNFLAELKIADTPGNPDPLIAVPDPYLLGPLAGKTRFVTAHVNRRFFNLPENNHWGSGFWAHVNRFQLALPLRSSLIGTSASQSAVASQTVINVNVNVGAIVAIIDDGLAFANARYRDSIRFFWNQDGTTRPYPSGFEYGTEYGPTGSSTGLIDAWTQGVIAAGGPQLDEEAVYARAGLTQLRRRVTHGAAVMDMATRNLADTAVICIQLPAHTTQDTSGASLGSYVLDALHYVLGCANAIASAQTSTGGTVIPIPVVVNLSYGDMAGPHDGTSMLEAAIDDFVRTCQALTPAQTFGVVIPAGNSHQQRCHAEFTLDASNSSKELQWRIHPDDLTPSFLEIWLPPGNDGSTVTVEVMPPNTTTRQPITIGSAWTWPNATEPVCTVVFPTFNANSSGMPAISQRRVIVVCVAPTAALETRALATAGLWRVVVRSTAAVAGNIDAWIERDDSPFGYPRRGRQSYFEDPNYVRFTKNGFICENDGESGFEGNPAHAYVKRSGTMNAIATGATTIVPAGYRASDATPARYSSSGSLTVPVSLPLLAQVSEDSIGHRGVLAGGTHSGSITAFGGTSIAAPQVANEIASLLTGSSNVLLSQTSPGPPPVATLTGTGSIANPAEVHGPVVIAQPAPPKHVRFGVGLLVRQPPPASTRVKRREVS